MYVSFVNSLQVVHTGKGLQRYAILKNRLVAAAAFGHKLMDFDQSLPCGKKQNVFEWNYRNMEHALPVQLGKHILFHKERR